MKKSIRNNIFYILIIIITNTYAQLPHTFLQKARNAHYGEARGLAVASNGTVFLANGDNGLRAYSYDGNSFTNIAHINDDGEACDVVVATDGTIFLANGSDGLRVYGYDGTSFTKAAHIDKNHNASSVTVTSSGMVFLASHIEGMFAYTYEGFLTSVENIDNSLMSFELFANYPNPFNPTTTINYNNPSAGHVELRIYNTLGQTIRLLVNSELSVGTHQTVWDGRDGQDTPVPSGVYFYQLQVGAVVETRKMVMMK